MFNSRTTLPYGIFILLFLLVINNAMAHGVISTEPVKLDVTTFPPMEDDIQALAQFSQSAKLAGTRLIERGDEILTIAHGVLADSTSPYPQRLQLLYVLGEIGNEDSATEIIHAIEDYPNNRYLYQNALLALSNFEPTEEINNFVNKQLETTKRDPLIQRSALNYYAKQPHDDANQWVEKYALNSSANPEVRYAALYMGGTLGMDSVKQGIIDILQNKQKNTREYYLLLGLAEITTPEEFAQLIDGLELDAGNVSKVKQFNLFRKGDATLKHGLAKVFISKGDATQKRAAIDYLIANQDAEALAKNWQYGDGAVRSAVKRAGYTINVDEHGASFVVVENNKSSFLWIFVISLSVLLGGFLLWRFTHSDMQKSS